MDDLKISSEVLVASANKMQMYNIQMRDAIIDVDRAMSQLDADWDGAASTAALTKYNEIKSKYSNQRYCVMDSCTQFLFQQIDEGYTQTETIVLALAEQFK